MRFCGAHRIGHGCALIRDKDLMQYSMSQRLLLPHSLLPVIDKRVCLEICVTSNVQTKAVSSLEKHPIRQFFDSGVLVVPSWYEKHETFF